MKKYIIVSLLIAVLFMGVGFSVAKAQTATRPTTVTLTFSDFSARIMDSLIKNGFVTSAKRSTAITLIKNQLAEMSSGNVVGGVSSGITTSTSTTTAKSIEDVANEIAGKTLSGQYCNYALECSGYSPCTNNVCTPPSFLKRVIQSETTLLATAKQEFLLNMKQAEVDGKVIITEGSLEGGTGEARHLFFWRRYWRHTGQFPIGVDWPGGGGDGGGVGVGGGPCMDPCGCPCVPSTTCPC